MYKSREAKGQELVDLLYRSTTYQDRYETQRGLVTKDQLLDMVGEIISAPEEPPTYDQNAELWDADPNCKHEVYCQSRGGVKCSKCNGWFCY